ncbi:MAG: hypothetical protein P8100_00615 [bacterium]
MENPANNDRLIREKFEHYSPAPPAHIWEGIQAGIATGATPGFFSLHGRKIAAAAAILLLVSLGLWLTIPAGSESDTSEDISRIEQDNASQKAGQLSESTDELPQQETKTTTDEPDDDTRDEVMLTEENESYTEDTGEKPAAEVPVPSVNDIDVLAASDKTLQKQEETGTADISTPERENTGIVQVNTLPAADRHLDNEVHASYISRDETVKPLTFENQKPSGSKWSHGIYFSPEIALLDFDSIRILPAYALNYEPAFHFSNHWFIRFGAGVNYARERGFAKVDYIANEVVGSYEDVYEVTFDTIGGTVVPTFHTKTTDVWDSVRHLQVTEVTNEYLYLQAPVLFGYYNRNPKFNWYFYGGPAFNLMMVRSIEKPEENISQAEIINLENNLPNRSDFYMQLWLGAGIEYKLGRNVALALEPSYRYHFRQVYNDTRINSALSGFSLRVGVVLNVN